MLFDVFLTFDRLGVHLYALRRELHADRGLGLEVELVPREARQQVRLADARVSDQHHCTQRKGDRELEKEKGKDIYDPHTRSLRVFVSQPASVRV